jgi:hypothetical protein
MSSGISRRHFFIGCAVILGSLVFPHIPLAGADITVDPSDVEFFEFQCTTMEVHPEANYLIVGEKRIELVDFLKGNKRYRTILKNSEGETIPLSSFKKGQWVFVRGFRLSDGLIAAREIYQLPAMAPRSDFYPFFKNVPTWGEPAE